MAALHVGCVAFIFCTIPVILAQIPSVTIEALRPKGVRIYLPDVPGLNFFVFQGNINKDIVKNDAGSISGKVENPRKGLWIYQDKNVTLRVGDVINYYVLISMNNKGHVRDNLRYRVTELVDSSITPSLAPDISTVSTPLNTASTRAPIRNCRPNAAVRNRSACAEQIMDKKKFDINSYQTSAPKQVTSNNAPPQDPAFLIEQFTPVRRISKNCKHSVTVVKGLNICSGQLIFEEYFDTIREDVWNIEQYLPSGPEFPFVSYQRSNKEGIVTVEKTGILRIEPKLQEKFPGFDREAIIYNNNKLDLNSGCTRPTSCVHINQGSQIMPPIASSRLTSHAFAFKYGIVEIRAKLPLGDWLYPDILLESVYKPYGTENYASGVLRIAGARGNSVLQRGNEDLSNKVLYGGPIMDFKCRTNLLKKINSTSAWGNSFHVYSLKWTPDLIALSVDGEEYGRINPTASGLHGLLPKDQCDPPRMLLTNPMAPFDNFFQIVLGVSAGGISEFPDQVTTQIYKPKPWKNTATKARLQFFYDEDSWFPTWSQPALFVDYIRVRAL